MFMSSVAVPVPVPMPVAVNTVPMLLSAAPINVKSVSTPGGVSPSFNADIVYSLSITNKPADTYDLNVGTVNEDVIVVKSLVSLSSMFLSNSIIGLVA